MSGTGSDCAICGTNNGDIVNVYKDFDLSDISVSREGTVDLTILTACLNLTITMAMLIHVDDNNHTFSNMLKHVVLQYVFVQSFIII